MECLKALGPIWSYWADMPSNATVDVLTFLLLFFTAKTICSMVNSGVNKTCFDAFEGLGFT